MVKGRMNPANTLPVAVLALLFLCGGCAPGDPIDGNTSVNGSDDLSVKVIDADGEFSAQECALRGLQDEVIMIESAYCGHCKATMPVFQEACEEKGITPTILDVSVKEQRERMESYGLQIQYTPTFIFGCTYVIGARQKEGYQQLLDEFLEVN
ncbi:hypothetical protein JXA12_03315 [Candidatus Woesearchaeota archaeon]|nr:hypothetical protein [Candidatus Woesearchaeota archaeon]